MFELKAGQRSGRSMPIRSKLARLMAKARPTACVALLLTLFAISEAPLAQTLGVSDNVAVSKNIASNADTSDQELARHLVPLGADDLSDVAAIWKKRVQENLALIAQIAGQLELAEEEDKPALATALRTVNQQNIHNFESYIMVLSAWGRKGGSEEDLEHHWDFVNGFIGEFLISFKILTTVQLAWDWLRAARGGLRVLGSIIQLVAIIAVAFILAGLVRKWARYWMKRSREEDSIAVFLVPNAMYWVLVLLGLLFGVWQQGINLGFTFAVLGGLGFLTAFVLQNVFQSILGGILLQTTRPYAKGDIVSINQTMGTIEDVNIVATKLRTFDNRLVQIPNQAVWRGVMENHTKYRVRRVDLVFGVGYSDDLEAAKQILSDIVAEDERCLKSPEARIFVGNLGASSVNLYCRPWVRTDDYWDVFWDLTERGKTKLQEAGVSIAFPQMDVHIRTELPTGPT